MTKKDKAEVWVYLFLLIVVAYPAIAAATFRMRHPWATDTEVFLNMDKVLTFDKMTYQEMAERENRGGR